MREWFLRTQHLAQARARQLSARQRRALQAATQALELADRAVDLPEGFRAGPPLGATLLLYQESVWWTLQAFDDSTASEVSLAQACATHHALLRSAAASDEQLERLRTQFLEAERRAFHALDEASQLALIGVARRFAVALMAHVGEPDARLVRLERQRWTRVLWVFAALLAIAGGVAYLRAPKDIAAGKTWRASSGAWTYARAGSMDKRGADGLLFHTGEEHNPWLVIDLGAPVQVRGVKVENRATCCQERAIPLIVEVSVDGKHWSVAARRDEPFTSWKARFQQAAVRYVRLRVPRYTIFHLSNVEILS